MPAVCMVVHAYYPLAEPRVQREARAARDAGYAVTVLALRAADEPAREWIDGICVRRLALRHVRGGGIARMLYEYLAFCLLASLWLTLRSVRRPFDIVHVHNPPDFLVVAALLPRVRGSRVILDIHDLSSHMFAVRVRGVIGAVLSRMLLRVERVACAVAHEVITVHAVYRAELVSHGVNGKQVSVVMNSVDDHVLEASHDSEPLFVPTTEFTVAYHGTITWWYGVDLIVDAVAALRSSGVDAGAIIVGAGDAVEEVRMRVQAAGLEEQVYVSGRYVPIEEAMATVAGATCGVIPNRPSLINRFALSSKLFEYVALGLPVVSARLETIALHFDGDEVTFFDPGSSSSLCHALQRVNDRPREAAEMVERARRRAQKYSWARERATFQEIYRRCNGQG